MKLKILPALMATVIFGGCATSLSKPDLQASNEVELGCGYTLKYLQATGATKNSDAPAMSGMSPVIVRKGAEQTGCKIVMDLHQFAGTGPNAAQQHQRLAETLIGAGAQLGATTLLPGAGKAGGIGINFDNFGNSTAGAGTNTDVDVNQDMVP